MAAGCLRVGQPLPTPQAIGHAADAVSLVAGRRTPEMELTQQYRAFLGIFPTMSTKMLPLFAI
jgi:hypothetical protein